MRTAALAATLLPLLCAASSAQDRAAEIDFENALRDRMQQVQQAPAKVQDPKKAKLLRTAADTLVHMNDSGDPADAGPTVSGWVTSNMRLDAAKQAEPATTRTEADGSKTIVLNEDLPPYPRTIAPYLARQAAPELLKDMPASSEKEFMRVSLMVRSWLELGGSPKALPVVEELISYKDDALAKEFKLWLDNGTEMALEKVGEATKTESLMVQIDRLEQCLSKKFFTPERRQELVAKLAALKAANKRFVEFVLAENEWRKANAFRLKA